MLTAILVMALGAVVLGGVLGYASIKFKVEGDPLVDKIDAVLPQTQCGQCGYPGCKPYAQAIASGEAEINQCPPGGEEGIRKLADLLGREFKPLAAEYGEEKPKAVAWIDENTCIGCTLCIQACPVDAIVGAAKQMHTIVAELCTGCELCLPPCPVDCITMVPIVDTVETWKWKYPKIPLVSLPSQHAGLVVAETQSAKSDLQISSEAVPGEPAHHAAASRLTPSSLPAAPHSDTPDTSTSTVASAATHEATSRQKVA